MLKQLFGTGLCIFFAANSIAGELGKSYEPNLDWGSIITLSGGPAWTNPGKDHYLYPNPPPMNNHFIPKKEWTTLGSGELFFGLQRFICPDVIGQFGIGVAAASDARLSGFINVNDVIDVIHYRYQVSHVRAEFKGKLIAAGYRLAQPYLSASAGVGFNHAHDYIPVSSDTILYPPSYFDSRSTVAFSYTLGAGLQRNLNQNWQVGVGYEFADWGKNYLGGDDYLLGQGPGSAHLYTHELVFSVSYLF